MLRATAAAATNHTQHNGRYSRKSQVLATRSSTTPSCPTHEPAGHASSSSCRACSAACARRILLPPPPPISTFSRVVMHMLLSTNTHLVTLCTIRKTEVEPGALFVCAFACCFIPASERCHQNETITGVMFAHHCTSAPQSDTRQVFGASGRSWRLTLPSC